MKLKIIAVILVIVALFFSVAIVQAQDDTPNNPTDNDVNAIAKQLYCPVCPNTPLDVCETKACSDWRNQIKNQLADGWSEEQIKEYFVEQYGERVLAEPQRKGFTSLVWILPIIAVAVGLIFIFQVLKSWKSEKIRKQIKPSFTEEISSEVLSKIEKEIRKID